jgi:glucokinase
MKNIACYDIGGTFIKYAIINSEGELLKKGKFDTPSYNCRITIPESIIKTTESLKKQFEIDSVGICTAGLVDSKNGVVTAAYNFHEYSGARLSETIERETGLKTFVENDVNAAALGEMWIGAAKGKSTFVCIALGTGVGGAIVINENVFGGVSGAAGEIGHIIVNQQGEQCSCGCIGCYERYSSTSAFIRDYINSAEKLGIKVDETEINGEKIMMLVKSGDSLAGEVYKRFVDNIATGIVSITHLLDPGLIVVGGGISAQGKTFFDDLNSSFRERVISSYASHTKIVQAQLGNDAGIYGACYIAL